jgi:hypothetical protein
MSLLQLLKQCEIRGEGCHDRGVGRRSLISVIVGRERFAEPLSRAVSPSLANRNEATAGDGNGHVGGPRVATASASRLINAPHPRLVEGCLNEVPLVGKGERVGCCCSFFTVGGYDMEVPSLGVSASVSGRVPTPGPGTTSWSRRTAHLTCGEAKKIIIERGFVCIVINWGVG